MSRRSQVQADLDALQERYEASGDLTPDLLASGLSVHAEFRPPPPGATIIKPLNPGAAEPFTRREKINETIQALREHVEAAHQRFNEEGFTEGQQRAIMREPTAAKRNSRREMHYGERIDTFVKESIQTDPRLNYLGVSEIKQRGPDFFDARRNVWYDITTAKSWAKHVHKYGEEGKGVFIDNRRR